MVVWWKPVLAVLASVGTIHAVLHTQKDRINVFFMKFFRDLGRYKALKRRTSRSVESKGLLAFLASEEDPLQELLELDAEKEDELHLPTYSRQELFDLGNHQSPDGTLLLAILGRVYDVTEGDKFYGEDGTYGHFAGHDVTYALATGCKALKCVETDWTQLETHQDNIGDDDKKKRNSPTNVFDDKELLEAKKWLSFFHLHDKYPLVGKLEGNSFEALVQELLAQDDEDAATTESSEQEMLDSIKS